MRTPSFDAIDVSLNRIARVAVEPWAFVPARMVAEVSGEPPTKELVKFPVVPTV
jgi:hypothetical protein